MTKTQSPTPSHHDGHPDHWLATDREHLLEIARRAVHHGVQHGRPLTVDPDACPARLRKPAAVFVTLFYHAKLRGCVGSLQAQASLAEETARHAYGAAFRDPRFPPLTVAELAALTVELSVLGEPEPMSFTDEAHLIQQLRPRVDGVILSHGRSRGTFLPTVWEHLPEPTDFLTHLKHKAGLPRGPLPDGAVVQRYTATKIA